MSFECEKITLLFSQMEHFMYPFGFHNIPKNGIYVLFEKDERGHGVERIVRVGTHTGNNQLQSRIKQHFCLENKDRSIFRKHIGRALLKKRGDTFINDWNIDLTTRRSKNIYSHLIDTNYQKNIEQDVTGYIRENFSLIVFEVSDRKVRLDLESKIVSTVSHCQDCGPSLAWLGNNSTAEKIVRSGLWQINELYKTPLSLDEISLLTTICAC